MEVRLWQDKNEYDHALVYYIAGWVKENIDDNIFVSHMKQEDLAEGITNSILRFIHNEKK